MLARRRSPRAFDPARAVARKTIRSLLEAARVASSSFTDQPWRSRSQGARTNLSAEAFEAAAALGLSGTWPAIGQQVLYCLWSDCG
ncbi:MAG: nitroreductase family protein [Acidobacteriota bacterium]